MFRIILKTNPFLVLNLSTSFGYWANNTKLIRTFLEDTTKSPIKPIRKFFTLRKLALVNRSFSLQASTTKTRSILGLQTASKGMKKKWIYKFTHKAFQNYVNYMNGCKIKIDNHCWVLSETFGTHSFFGFFAYNNTLYRSLAVAVWSYSSLGLL